MLSYLMYIPVPLVFVLTYFVGVGLERVWPLSIGTPLPGVVAAAIFVVGAFIAGWGWLTFRRAGTTTIPGERSSKLVTWGPYRFSRNPMYVGLSIAYLGEAAILRQVWPALLLPLVWIYLNSVVIPVEEGRLKEVFGDAYDQFRGKVRRWI